MVEGLPEEANDIGNPPKRQRRMHAHHCLLFTRAQGVSRQKFELPRMPANQIRALSGHALTGHALPARLLRVYKASPVVSKPFG